MTISLQSILYPLPALCVAIVIHTLTSWLLNRPPAYARALEDFALDPSVNTGSEAPLGSWAFRLRLFFNTFGLEVNDRESFYHYLSIAVMSLGLVLGAALLALPPLFWLGCPLISYFLINHLVNSQWDRLCREIEKEIPSYLMIR